MIITTKNYAETMKSYPINIKEVYRYCGGNGGEKLNEVIEECIYELKDELSYKLCFAECPITVTDNIVDFSFARTESKDLSKNLSDCDNAVMFSATIGFGIDRLIKKYSMISPVKALVLGAIGAERIESLCDVFNDEIKKKYSIAKPRFSAGYGDLPLEFQKEIFEILKCNKNIGVSLNKSMLMSPTKSVTAIIGVIA